jgi:zinc protease
VVFGLAGIMRDDPDFMPGYVANYILGGGGFSSRLTDEVRVKRGLTYGITTQLTPLRRASLLLGSVATRADAVRQTIDVVKETMSRFAASGPTQQELNDAKTYLTGSFPLSMASDSGIASQLAVFQRQGLDVGYVTRRNSLINAVTLDQVKRVAKKLFDPARLTVVVAGTIQDGKAPSRPAAPVRPAPQPQAGTAPARTNPSTTPPNPPKTTPAAKPAVKPAAPPPAKP